MSAIHVIAEAGTNHNGDVGTGKQLIEAAAKAGADSVKFQIIHPEELYLPDNPAIEMRRKTMLADADWGELAAAAADAGLGFSASVFGTKGLDVIDALDPPYLKIASTDLNNTRFVREVAERGRRVILSTGMSTIEEVERGVAAVSEAGNEDLVLLHCVSVYPVSLAQMRLWFIDELKRFGVPVGLSDHTESNEAAAIAVAKGCTWFEKHLTLDRASEGFDHAYAMEPAQMASYVAAIREAEQALDPSVDKLGPDERGTAERARRALYAAEDLAEGDELTPERVLVVRPQAAMAADEADAVVGRRVKRAIARYEPLTPDALD